MLQRFIERFERWREVKAQEKRDTNPLNSLAFVAALLVAVDGYTAITSHHLKWRALVDSALLIAFLVLYIRKSQWAWLVIPIFGALGILEAPLVYVSTQPQVPPRVRLFALCFLVGFGAAAILYGLFIRRRYHLYLETQRRYRDADTQTTYVNSSIPLLSQKRLLRLISARADMHYAMDAFSRLRGVTDEDFRYHLFLSMVVSYCRPFTENYGIGSLLCEYPDYPTGFSELPDLQERHRRMLKLRNTFLSHSSIQGTVAVVLAPHAVHPARQEPTDDYDYAVAKIHFLHPEYAPWFHALIEALAHRLDIDIPLVVREVGGEYLKDGEAFELDTGRPEFTWDAPV